MAEKKINKDTLDLVKLSIKYVEGTHNAINVIDDVIGSIDDQRLKQKLETTRDTLIDLSSQQINKVVKILSETDE